MKTKQIECRRYDTTDRIIKDYVERMNKDGQIPARQCVNSIHFGNNIIKL